MCAQSIHPVQLFVTLWTAAHQAPQSMGFSQQEYWYRFPFLFPGNLPDPGIKPDPGILHCRQILFCWATRELQIRNHCNYRLEIISLRILFSSFQCHREPIRFLILCLRFSIFLGRHYCPTGISADPYMLATYVILNFLVAPLKHF